MNTWTHIVIHHTASSDTTAFEVERIRRWHVEGRSFREIGYHGATELVGERYEVIAGRPMNWTGSHALGWNTKALGMALVGNFMNAPPPNEQLRVAASHVAGWADVLGISTGRIIGHRDTGRATSCPGDAFDMSRFRQLVEQYRR